MFGSGGKFSRDERRKKREGNLSQLGLMDVKGVDEFGNINISDDDDGDLEAELNQLVYGSSKSKKPIKNKVGAQPPDLDSMVASCMEDVASDDEDVDDGEVEAELLDELQDLIGGNEIVETPVNKLASSRLTTFPDNSCEEPCAGSDMLSVIETRITMYMLAEKKAKLDGETARSRRFARGLATLEVLGKKIKAGKAVNPDDIPPAIASSSTNSALPSLINPQSEEPPSSVFLPSVLPKPDVAVAPAASESLIPTESSEKSIAAPAGMKGNCEIVSTLKAHRERYKTFALKAKTDGDKHKAMWGLKAVRLCDTLLEKTTTGETVNISELPDYPPTNQTSAEPPHPSVTRPFSRDDPIYMPENSDDIPPIDPVIFGAPPPPTTIQNALTQRLAKYRQDEARAKSEGNSSKIRRLGRICKQYENALKLHQSGERVPVEELPSPPGFAPIPLTDPPPEQSSSKVGMTATAAVTVPSAAAKQQDSTHVRKSMTSTDKMVVMLEKRQAQFKSAALEAKKTGQMEEAKEYLRQYKGFDKLIDAAKGGLPVDVSTLPVPPRSVKAVTMDFEIVSKEDCTQPSAILDSKSRQQMYSKLEKDLLKQAKMCDTNMKHFKLTGEVASANKFQQMFEHTKRDLDSLRFAFKRGDVVPRFHYEVRAFSRIVCNPDLTDPVLELTLVRGINYNVQNPKEVDTYCRIEFPYPKEAPFKDKTILVKDTNNPEYNHVFMVPINPKDKICQRLFKRQSLKVEVWSKGGFLRSHIQLGTATVKLQPLETSCTLHDTYPLMEGRKVVGGQIEVKIRIRNAMVTKQIEKVEEQWLVISFT